jgi:hypothetical protein
MIRVLFVLVVAALGASAVPAKAADIHPALCDCSTDQIWENRAKGYRIGYTGYLYSFAARQLRKFRVDYADGGGDPAKTYEMVGMLKGGSDVLAAEKLVTWLPVETKYQTYFDDMLAVRDYFGRPLSGIPITYQMPPGATDNRGNPVGTYNAYDIVNTPAFSNNLSDFLNERREEIMGQSVAYGLANKLSVLLQTIDKVVADGEILKVTITLKLTDGSEMKFEMSADTDGEAERKVGSGKDSNNNPVLEQIGPTSGGNYIVKPQDLDSFYQNMLRQGVTITRGSGTRVIRYKCTWNGVKLSCSIE